WRGYVYDANLNELGNLADEIYATTLHGDLAFSATKVFNAATGQSIYTLPFSSTATAVSGNQDKVYLFNTTTHQLTVIPLTQIGRGPGPGLNPSPANGEVVGLPLSKLSWTASPFAVGYTVYLGTNAAALAAATTNSPEFLGTVTSPSITLSNALQLGR